MDALGEWFVELRTVAETSSDSGSDFASESAPSAEVACKSNGPGQWSSNGEEVLSLLKFAHFENWTLLITCPK